MTDPSAPYAAGLSCDDDALAAFFAGVSPPRARSVSTRDSAIHDAIRLALHCWEHGIGDPQLPRGAVSLTDQPAPYAAGPLHHDFFDVYIERLAHYRCPDCEHWWSIGDGPTERALYCPHCGLRLEPTPPASASPAASAAASDARREAARAADRWMELCRKAV